MERGNGRIKYEKFTSMNTFVHLLTSMYSYTFVPTILYYCKYKGIHNSDVLEVGIIKKNLHNLLNLPYR